MEQSLNPRSNIFTARVFLLWTTFISLIISVSAPACAQINSPFSQINNTDQLDLEGFCFTGFSAYNLTNQVSDSYIQTEANGQNTALLQPKISGWLHQLNWQNAYDHWLQLHSCSSALQTLFKESANLNCRTDNIENLSCQNTQDSLAIFAMHRHLLDSVRAQWNGLEKTFASWDKFPASEDAFPEFLHPQFSAWPDEILSKAKLVDQIMMLEHAELIRRWPTEADFVHWLQCGSEQLGLAPDSLYQAILNNNISGEANDFSTTNSKLDQFYFWYGLGWLDQAWTRYRMRIGLTKYEPEFQANIIQQCLILESLTSSTPNATSAPANQLLFNKGYLNSALAGTKQHFLGEILSIDEYPDGTQFLTVDLHRIGVEPISVTSHTKLQMSFIHVGDQFEFSGEIMASAMLKSEFTYRVNGPTFFILESLLSAK